MTTNDTGQGSMAADWPFTAGAPTAHQQAPVPTTTEPPSAAPPGSHGLILPDSVALMLDTALSGDTAPAGSLGPDGRPRAKNLTVIVGTVRVVTTGRGEGRRVFTNLGAAEYRYELSINEVVGDAHGAARTSYRLPIALRADAERHHDERGGTRPR